MGARSSPPAEQLAPSSAERTAAERVLARREQELKERLRELVELDRRKDELLGVLDRQVRHMERLLEELLKASRVHLGEHSRRAADPPPTAAVPAAPAARRVLIVDDNRDGTESLALLLRLAGHEVHTFYDGSSALGAVSALAPDFIVVDIGLPDLDGCTLARRLRAQGCTAQLAAVSGYGQPEDRRRAREAGFDHYFVKPIEPLDLERVLRAGAAGDTFERCAFDLTLTRQ